MIDCNTALLHLPGETADAYARRKAQCIASQGQATAAPDWLKPALFAGGVAAILGVVWWMTRH